MDIRTIYPYLGYLPGSGNFGPGSDYVFDTSQDGHQHALSPAWQISTHSGAFPSKNPITKRVTIQVGQLDYEAAGEGEVSEEITNDMQSNKVLMDFNTEDLYTRNRGSDEWEGPWPEFQRNYGNLEYGDDTDTIRPIKGAPVRFRKIPLCTTQGTGYFYTLASAPYIITGVRDDNPSKETGYLSDWAPTDTQLSIDCCGADITGNFFYASLFEMFPDLSEEDDITDIYKTGYSNLFSGVIKDPTTCKYDLIFRSITGVGCVQTSLDENLIYISGTSFTTGNSIPLEDEMTYDESLLQTYSNIYSGNRGEGCSGDLVFRSITGAGCVQTTLDGNIIFVSGTSFTTGNSIPLEDEMTFDESLLQTYSNIYSGNRGEGCSGDLVFRSITGAGCVQTTLDGNIIFVSGTSFTTGNSIPLEDEMTFDESLLQTYSNIYSGNRGEGCSGDLVFRSITGIGGISTSLDGNIIKVSGISGVDFTGVTGEGCMIGTYKEDGVIYITGNTNFYDKINNTNLIESIEEASEGDPLCGSGINFYHITGAEGIGTDVQTLEDGNTYIRITGGGFSKITGEECMVGTYEEDGVVYITGNTNFYDKINNTNLIESIEEASEGDPLCGSGINFYHITGAEGIGTDVQTLEDGNTYIRITGGGFSKITGEECMVGTYEEDGVVYITGNTNFYDKINDTNLIESIEEASEGDPLCGSGINFYSITGEEGIGTYVKDIGGVNYITITGAAVTTGVNITGGSCIHTEIDQVGEDDYIKINFTGQVVTTGNTDDSNLFQDPAFADDTESCSTNGKVLRLKNIITDRSTLSGIHIDETNTDIGIHLDCPSEGSNGWRADPTDTSETNNPLYDCGFRLRCVELCDDDGNTFAAVIPLRYLDSNGEWSETPEFDTDCPSS